MFQVKITGSVAYIRCDEDEAKWLDEQLTFEIPGARHAQGNYRGWDRKVHFFSTKTGRLPSGLVGLLRKMVSEDQLFITGEDSLPISIIKRRQERLNHIEMRGIEALSKFQKGAILRADENPIGIIKVATNGGKTEVALGIILTIGKPTLYLVNRKVLLHQVAERIKERSGIKCGKIGDGLNQVRPITVGMVQSLPKPIKQNAPFYDQFKILIMDEAQHGSANTWYRIALTMKARYKYALSGTPWTGEEIKDLRLISCFGPKILADVRNQELIRMGWSARPTIHLWHLVYPENRMRWRTAYDSMIINSSLYNETLIEIARRCWEEKKQTLILVNRTAHGNLLYRRLIGEKIDCCYLSGSSNSEYREKMLKKFKAGRISTIVATTIFDEGVDVPAINSLILGGGGKAQIALLQRIGRALRKKKGSNVAEIHDFITEGNHTLYKHSLRRIQIYRDEEFDIKRHKPGEIEVELSSNKLAYQMDWNRFHREENR